jgi:hypothetical protein
MQISAANLLLASQQGAKPAPAVRPDGAFATALANKEPVFEPLAFKPVETSARPAPQAKPPAPPMASAPMGSQIDIRV